MISKMDGELPNSWTNSLVIYGIGEPFGVALHPAWPRGDPQFRAEANANAAGEGDVAAGVDSVPMLDQPF